MHPSAIDLMRSQARAIYQALTGKDLPSEKSEEFVTELPVEEVARRFADLDAMARQIPKVTERMPSFSFVPPLDVSERDQELVIEMVAPGIDRDDVAVEVYGDTLVISGVAGAKTDGHSYLHKELPSGPFYRVVKLPFAVSADPRVELERGLIVIRLRKSAPERRGRAAS